MEIIKTKYLTDAQFKPSRNQLLAQSLCHGWPIDHTKRKVMRNALLEFIRYGLPYVFPPEKEPIATGVPTAFSAPVMSSQIVGSETVVWPHVQGSARGESISPLYPNAVDVALQDEQMYGLLALIDVMRIGKVREKEVAIELLKNRIISKAHA